MTDTTASFSEVAHFNRSPIRRGTSQRTLARATVFAVSVAAVLVGWLMGSTLVAPSSTGESPAPAQPPQATIVPGNSKSVANPYGALARAKRVTERPPLLSDPGFALDLFLGNRPDAPVAAAPVAADASPQVALSNTPESVPLPPARPSFLRPHVDHETVEEAPAPRAPAPSAPAPTTPATTASSTSSTPSDNRTFFQKLFGTPSQAPSDILAYAQTALGSSTPYDQYTAVYDVAAHVVYLPDGEKLEAHSGLGDLLDDPGHANAKDRGATPPHLYDLELRRQLFHGVQALRLDPVGNGAMYGRVGLLAHTYMLGPKGDSNGCVSFRDYTKFLRAFMSGQVKHLVVVSHLT